MGSNDHTDFELHEQIEDLVAEGLLEEGTAGFGIAQQVIERGYKSLSEAQLAVYDSVVVPALKQRREELERQRILDGNPD